MTLRSDLHLKAAFEKASPEHFAWRTNGGYVARCERELVREAFLPLGARILDVGCGEGATLAHLGAPPGAVGVDLFEGKLAFAREVLPACRFVSASAYELPFEPASFDQVIVRDLVHHLEQPERFVDECARVLAPGGRLDVLEPCRYNPLILLHALSRPEERGELRSTPRFIETLFGRRFRIVATTRHQPLPLHRVIFHPDFGRPALAARPAVQSFVRDCERWAGRLLPRALWAYLHVRALCA
jgi:SAM-dependent methyltransferase